MFRCVLCLHTTLAYFALTFTSLVALSKDFRMSDEPATIDSECSERDCSNCQGDNACHAHVGSCPCSYPGTELIARLQNAANRIQCSANQVARRAWDHIHTVPCRKETYAPDLFYNYHVGPNCGATWTAGMYPSPYPTPAVNGGTYYTYQPLLPHEYMYKHERVYHRYYNHGMGLNRTRVTYSPNHTLSVRRIMNHVLEPINYR